MAGDAKACFVVTPIGAEGSETRRRSDQVLRFIIEPVLEEFGYGVERADRISQPGIITNQVVDRLLDSDLVIADLTDRNPNVFYELGIRHATRKPVITIIEQGELIPFDVSQSRTIMFNYRDLESVDRCKSELRRQVQATEENPDDFFTPVSVAVDVRAVQGSGDPAARLDVQVLSALQALQADVGRMRADLAEITAPSRSEYNDAKQAIAEAQAAIQEREREIAKLQKDFLETQRAAQGSISEAQHSIQEALREREQAIADGQKAVLDAQARLEEAHREHEDNET